MAKVKPIPDGYPRVTPYLHVDGATRAIEFYSTVFGATERMRMPAPGGRIGHAELQIGDTRIMLNDEFPDRKNFGPKSLGGTPFGLIVYTPDVDSAFKQAIAAGATEKMPVENQFWGDRMGTLTDPFGHSWSIATHVEDVPPEQFEERMAQSQKQRQQQPETV